ncbi:hypothetical protein PC129_g2781 [Phytophthora cactorum]|uniref:Reverse transcriptase Ty1/copia-type domain-containing protein n=1 Tax=Phytophthora cactorum TaxID=29920 RepID=A0A8T1E8N5_9STRA|nr:hypothetical protein PC111_g4824 [Phytophthora cactorum]KAG2862837.1 hypothetical protein PC113_g5971 [Phytophthora cactorum]KAG2948623.1 hypothetical protein PC117_g5878 [Phytophthora cactorum]KAG2992378.1 hypothetical protein PC118_g4602 [Phytophthora cactorum]KAG3032669.1 hypothetical protein PC119_g5577 [Phytophthora cactorum]
MDMLKEFGMEMAHSVSTPIGEEWNGESESNAELLPAAGSGETPTITKFQSLIGGLLWVARCTRPDIAFAVHKASRRTHCPTIADWKLAKRILRYLSGTKSLSLLMGGDWSEVCDGRLHHYGWDGHGLDLQEAGRRGVIHDDTAASVIGQEILGIRELLGELEVACVQPFELRVDNQAALKQLEGEEASSKAKHIDVRIKFVVHYTKKGVLKPQYWESERMPADVFAKVLAVPRLHKLRTLVGLH